MALPLLAIGQVPGPVERGAWLFVAFLALVETVAAGGAAAGGLRPPARCRANPAAGMFWGRGHRPRPQNAAAPPAERPGGRGGACRAPGLAALGPAKAIAPWPAGFSLGKGC